MVKNKTKKKATKKVVKKVEKPLTKKEQERVEVLKDAIAQLRLEIYNSTPGSYIITAMDLPDSEDMRATCTVLGVDIDKLQANKILKNLINKDNPCNVCAKGAMAISAIRKLNHYTVGDLVDFHLDADLAIDKSKELFGDYNADLMEAFYENSFVHGNLGDSVKYLLDLREEFYNTYQDSTERMIAIFKNAIRNRGTFKPELEKL